MRPEPNRQRFLQIFKPRFKNGKTWKLSTTMFGESFALIIAIMALSLYRAFPLLIASSKSVRRRVYMTSPSLIDNSVDEWRRCHDFNAEGVRLFNPSFPSKIRKSLSATEVEEVIRVREILGADMVSTVPSPLEKLPWKALPLIKIVNQDRDTWSKSEIDEAYEKFKHTGYIVWAHKLAKPEKGCLLMNHWQQKLIYVVDYDYSKGTKGYEITIGNNNNYNSVIWPPLALESEISKNLWQPVRCSQNINNGSIFSYFPAQMTKAPWELVFLLLINDKDNAESIQALFDTGLCPKQGFIAYLRLLDQIQLRTEEFEGIPSYRQITENELKA